MTKAYSENAEGEAEELTDYEKSMILRKIEGLQQSRNYADEVESKRYSAEIRRLLEFLD